MMSVNDDARDPHFRKAAFDAHLCPADCPRPCEKVCPAYAIAFPSAAVPHSSAVQAHLQAKPAGGVLEERYAARLLNACSRYTSLHASCYSMQLRRDYGTVRRKSSRPSLCDVHYTVLIAVKLFC
jgi:hypothetical protein